MVNDTEVLVFCFSFFSGYTYFVDSGTQSNRFAPPLWHGQLQLIFFFQVTLFY